MPVLSKTSPIHTLIARFGAGGAALGVLSSLEGIFQPVATHASTTTLAGGGLAVTAVSILGAIAGHVGLSRQEVATGTSALEARLPEIDAALSEVAEIPVVKSTIAKVEAAAKADVGRVEKLVTDGLAALPGPVALDVKSVAKEVRAQIAAEVNAEASKLGVAPEVKTVEADVAAVVDSAPAPVTPEPQPVDANGNPILPPTPAAAA